MGKISLVQSWIEYIYYTNEPKLHFEASVKTKIVYISITIVQILIFGVFYFMNTSEWHNIWYTSEQLEKYEAKFPKWALYYSYYLHVMGAVHLIFQIFRLVFQFSMLSQNEDDAKTEMKIMVISLFFNLLVGVLSRNSVIFAQIEFEKTEQKMVQKIFVWIIQCFIQLFLFFGQIIMLISNSEIIKTQQTRDEHEYERPNFVNVENDVMSISHFQLMILPSLKNKDLLSIVELSEHA